MSSSSAKELEVITNQPLRSSSIPQRDQNALDFAPDLLKETTYPEKEETGSQDALIFDDHQLKDRLLKSSEDTLTNEASNTSNGSTKQLNEDSKTLENKNQPVDANSQNGAANSTKAAAEPISKKSAQGPSKNSRDHRLNGPELSPGTEELSLSLCLMQCCNLCSACISDGCDQYFSWCCCCFTDSEICVSCCTGCMECCTACDCACCN